VSQLLYNHTWLDVGEKKVLTSGSCCIMDFTVSQAVLSVAYCFSCY
jgi:hypothetical protein